MAKKLSSEHTPIFEQIKQLDENGTEFWSSRDLGKVLEYLEYRNFQPAIERAKEACQNSGQQVENHFVDMHEMVAIGSGAKREMPSVRLSRYACYLIVQNADPAKEVVALGQTYFAVQTRLQEIRQMDGNSSEIIIYQTKDGTTKVDVQLVDETVWLAQDQMALLFQKAKSTINEHIKNIFEEGELVKELVVRKFGISEFSTKPTNYYNLDVIISVGYRVKSQVGTHFRIWATQRLREYIIKGFTLDDERLKKARNNYFDELLARIRDIRSSERIFYRKVCDIFATSIDYNAQTELAKTFFATVQNKFHWAIHAHTAAELIKLRANADSPNMGLTNFPGEQLKKNDVTVAKNYLNAEELEQLNRIVNQFLEFAELQAMQRKPMHMQDWTTKLHGFLTLNDREILNHPGKVSHTEAEAFALAEYEKYRVAEAQRLENTEDDLDRAIKNLNPPKNESLD